MNRATLRPQPKRRIEPAPSNQLRRLLVGEPGHATGDTTIVGVEVKLGEEFQEEQSSSARHDGRFRGEGYGSKSGRGAQHDGSQRIISMAELAGDDERRTSDVGAHPAPGVEACAVPELGVADDDDDARRGECTSVPRQRRAVRDDDRLRVDQRDATLGKDREQAAGNVRVRAGHGASAIHYKQGERAVDGSGAEHRSGHRGRERFSELARFYRAEQEVQFGDLIELAQRQDQPQLTVLVGLQLQHLGGVGDLDQLRQRCTLSYSPARA